MVFSGHLRIRVSIIHLTPPAFMQTAGCLEEGFGNKENIHSLNHSCAMDVSLSIACGLQWQQKAIGKKTTTTIYFWMLFAQGFLVCVRLAYFLQITMLTNVLRTCSSLSRQIRKFLAWLVTWRLNPISFLICYLFPSFSYPGSPPFCLNSSWMLELEVSAIWFVMQEGFQLFSLKVKTTNTFTHIGVLWLQKSI